MSRIVGSVLLYGGLLAAACLFWATVFDGAPGTWQWRAVWGALGVGALIVAAFGGAALDSEGGE